MYYGMNKRINTYNFYTQKNTYNEVKHFKFTKYVNPQVFINFFHFISISNDKIGNIYLLMRSKKGKSIEQRLEELTKNEVGYL